MRYIMNRLAVVQAITLAVLSLAGAAYGMQVEMSSTLNPVGSGARATGMGGAFISVADDATAASWNPAGLIHLERPEVSVVYSYFSRSQDYHSRPHPEIEITNSMDTSGLNYASAAYPFVLLKRNMIVSLNYQRLYEMSKKVDFRYTWDIRGDKLYDSISFVQKGYLYAMSPAFAVQVVPQLYLGATVNFWGDYLGHNGWSNTYRSTATGTVFGNELRDSVDATNRISFKGSNAHFGFLWSGLGPFTVGGVYKTAFDGKLRKESVFTEKQEWIGSGEPPTESTSRGVEDLVMKMPASYGLGISYRHSDAWNVALDLYRTEWSRFFVRDSRGNETNPIDGTPLSEGRLKDTTQVRLGTEYLIIKENYVIPLRAGLFYDPEPTKKGSDDFYGFSLGTGLSKKKFSLDASYQFRFGRKISGDLPTIDGMSADINQHTVMMSLIYYF